MAGMKLVRVSVKFKEKSSRKGKYRDIVSVPLQTSLHWFIVQISKLFVSIRAGSQRSWSTNLWQGVNFMAVDCCRIQGALVIIYLKHF